MSNLEDIMAILRSQQANVQSKQGALQRASAPQQTAFRNEGQSGMDVLRRGEPDQRRALMEIGLGLMGHQTGASPGQTIGASVSRGFDILDEIRGRKRKQGMESAAVGLGGAKDNRDNSYKTIDAMSKLLPKGESSPTYTYGKGGRYTDQEGNQYLVSQARGNDGSVKPVYTKIDPSSPDEPVGKLDPLGPNGLTAPERIQNDAEGRRLAALQANSAQNAQKAYNQFQSARASIGNIDEALMALENGAETGPLSDLFPSFRASTIALEKAGVEMGLNVIGSVTFGALSKGELDLALSKDLPTNMEEGELQKYLIGKREAQLKLMDELEKAASFFESGGLPSQYIAKLKEEGRYERVDPAANKEINDIVNRILGQ